MKSKWLFMLAAAGLLLGVIAAYVFAIQKPLPAPAFTPASNPYGKGIYAIGMVESDQPNGENTNIYPEVTGTVAKILVTEGQAIKAGDSLLQIDDSIQRATAAQLESQAQAAKALLDELKAEPRKETLLVTAAQVQAARASLKTVQDELAKQQKSYDLDPKSISKDALDNARNSALVAKANLDVASRQYDLTKAGAWIYDIQNQEKQYSALENSYKASAALLGKYMLHAPSDGTVLSINTTIGGYVSSQGAYDTYTSGNDPVIVVGSGRASLHVRCYIDEILVHRLTPDAGMKAQMFIRGTDIKVPLEFVRVQPYVTPKIELSDQKQEQVDVRVLPVIFSFVKPKDLNLYPGQQVDVYVSE